MEMMEKSDAIQMDSGTKTALVWITAALVFTFPATRILNGSYPIFSLVLLGVPLVVLLRSRDASLLGFRAIRVGELLKYGGMSLAGSLGLMAIFEPWSHTYQMLVIKAVESSHPDTTFGWLVKFPGVTGWWSFVLYAGLVSLFAEELFFRGWLLNRLKRKMSEGKAIVWQATLFTLPQLLAACLLPTLQGVLYALVYSWLAIGLIGGWAASRTGSIWPSLVSATLYNLILCLLVR